MIGNMYRYNANVVRVYDGDTVWADIDLGFGIVYANQRIRLYGIDTPESRTRDLEEKKYGLMAKEYVLNRMPIGSKQIIVTHMDDKGKFGRILGKFAMYDTKDDRQTFLHEIMIRDHLGVAYYGQSKNDIAAEHLKNRELLQ